jgi:hypothetical protein
MTDAYVTVADCERKHKESADSYKSLAGLMNEINARLFKDNGSKSIQSRLNAQEKSIYDICENQKRMDGALTRLFWTVATPLIMGALWACYAGVKFLITTGKL